LKLLPPQVDPHDVIELLACVQGDLHSVEQIAGKRYVNNELEFLIVWKGYPVEESTWEPEYVVVIFL
jgi:hypothetical protein